MIKLIQELLKKAEINNNHPCQYSTDAGSGGND